MEYQLRYRDRQGAEMVYRTSCPDLFARKIQFITVSDVFSLVKEG